MRTFRFLSFPACTPPPVHVCVVWLWLHPGLCGPASSGGPWRAALLTGPHHTRLDWVLVQGAMHPSSPLFQAGKQAGIARGVVGAVPLVLRHADIAYVPRKPCDMCATRGSLEPLLPPLVIFCLLVEFVVVCCLAVCGGCVVGVWGWRN